jgi:hypothetical protein
MTSLEIKIWAWMLNDLSTPRAEFNGHSVCPWISVYQDRIRVVEVESGIREPIETAIAQLKQEQLMAVCLAFPKKPAFGTLEKTVDNIINQPQYHNIDILLNNHRLDGCVRGVFTGFKLCDLVIIQDTAKLNWARIASKKAGYYRKQ